MSDAGDSRPDPDELLRQVREQERQAARGRLTVFLGAAPGVGKTWAMLESAREERGAGRDVLPGVVETHGRKETEALLAGLEPLPRRPIEYKGITLHEFDLDAALARRPALLLVDELAHTNAPGTRHPKRWQDVEELLDAGIDVYTTVNVQHLESLNDVVARITGIAIRETVPDRVFDQAHEVRLVDLPPDALRERLREGKVYVPAQAARAVEHFFRKGNLIALRELALRRTAERVDAQMQQHRLEHGIERTWLPSDRLLVCVSPSPYSAQVVRSAARMAQGLHVAWYAVHVETPDTLRMPDADRARLAGHLRLAERMGAETAVLHGERMAEALMPFARDHGVTKIVVGKPRHIRLRDRLRGSFTDEVLRLSGDIDVFATAGESGIEPSPLEPPKVPSRRARSFLAAAGLVAAASGFNALVFGRDSDTDVAMVYLLGVMVAALRLGYWPSLFAAGLSVAAFDFLFIPPYYTFDVSDVRHAATFLVMFAVALVVSHLARRVRNQAHAARDRERRTGLLYGFSQQLARTTGREHLGQVAAEQMQRVLGGNVALFCPDATGQLATLHRTDGAAAPDEEMGIVRWVWANGHEAGIGTDTLPGASGLYVPLMAATGTVGVLGIQPADAARLRDPEERRTLEALASQAAAALERASLAAENERRRVEAEREQLRNVLLSSVSHDLRTPLATITGSASTLLADGDRMSSEARTDLVQAIQDEAERLNRRVRDLLDMTRLESGTVTLHRDWQPLEEVVGAALTRLERALGRRPVTTDLPPDLPLVMIDGQAIEQVLLNLLENAMKYSDPDAPIRIAAREVPEGVEVEVADRGPGIPPGDEERIFQKFYRGAGQGRASGVGLGLAVCRALVQLHGGTIHAAGRDGGGASFRFLLPHAGEPPALDGGDEG